MAALGVAVGIVGGVCGIGGGSLLGPILVGTGLAVTTVAPAAPAVTFLASVAGVATYAALSLTTDAPTGPDWVVGILCGFGGHLGTRLPPRAPEAALRLLRGAPAVGLALTYVVAAARG